MQCNSTISPGVRPKHNGDESIDNLRVSIFLHSDVMVTHDVVHHRFSAIGIMYIIFKNKIH